MTLLHLDPWKHLVARLSCALALGTLPLLAQPGPPPDGLPPGAGPAQCTLKGAYTVEGGEPRVERGRAYTAGERDLSAILVGRGGELSLFAPTVDTHGQTSSQEGSSFFGLNAAVLAAQGGRISIHGGSIQTSGEGANGAFATEGSTLNLAKVRIRATGGGGHGVMATQGGRVTLSEVDISTTGAHGAPIATDRGGGTITVRGGSYVSSGAGSPPLYSTGVITVADANLLGQGSEGVVIEGANSVALSNCQLRAGRLCGAMIYQSFSGDAEGQDGVFSMSGGSFTALEGPLFNVNNTHARITLKGVQLAAPSGILVKAAASRWGNPGANGGTVELRVETQVLAGDLVADGLSTLNVSLGNRSVLRGAVNTARTAKAVNLELDASSEWRVSADSYLTILGQGARPSGGTIRNIVGNGHTVFYKASAAGNAWLGGRTYELSGGGRLMPW